MEHIDIILLQINCTVSSATLHCPGRKSTTLTLTTSIDLPIILEQVTMRISVNSQNLPKFFSKSKLQPKYFHSKFREARKMINQFALGRGHDFNVTQETQMIYKLHPP